MSYLKFKEVKVPMSKILILNSKNEIISAVNNVIYVKANAEQNGYLECVKSEAIGLMAIEQDCIYPIEFTSVTVSAIPEGIEISPKYCFEESKGFYLNPNWKEPPKSLDELTAYYEEIKSHQAKVEIDIDYRLSMFELGLV